MAVKRTNDGKVYKQGREKDRVDETHVHTIKSNTVHCSPHGIDNCKAAQQRQKELNNG